MPWRKNRPRTSGEMDFHLTGLRRIRGDTGPERDWMAPPERRI